MKAIVVSSAPLLLRHLVESIRPLAGVGAVDGFAGSMVEFAANGRTAEPELLVLDCERAPLAELDALAAYHERRPGMRAMLVARAPDAAFLLRALRLGVREVISPEVDQAELEESLRRIQAIQPANAEHRGTVIALLSCKGGGGSTFLATNLGYAIADGSTQRVLMIDLNLQFGDSPLYVSDRRPAVTLADMAREIDRLDAGFLESSLIDILPNYGLLAAPEDPAQAGEVKPAHITRLLELARANYDYVILDIGRSIDPVTLAALDAADTVMPIVQLSIPCLRQAKRLLQIFRSLEYPPQKLRPIINRHTKATEITIEDAQSALGVRFHTIIPNHYASASASINQGQPILRLAPSSPITRSLRQMAEELAPAPRAKSGLMGRLFGRT